MKASSDKAGYFALSLFAVAISQGIYAEEDLQSLEEVTVRATKIAPPQAVGAYSLDEAHLAPMSTSTSDTANLLRDVPGVSLYGAGGVSSLPVIHGMADDRVRTKVDGVDSIASCPNHMNSPLSYIDPTNVGELKVFAGITPVSMGGDSIGGTIIANTQTPEFSGTGQRTLTKGELGARYGSNGNSRRLNANASIATEAFSIIYNGATSKSDNYKSAGNFKNYTATGNPGQSLGLNEVGSTAYDARNHMLGLAMKSGDHLVEAKIAYQDIPYELYPNQRMDMLGNTEHRYNLRYLGQRDWGNLEARVYEEDVRHHMDFGADKMFVYGAAPGVVAPGMPMDTKSKTTGVNLKADIDLSKHDLLRVGGEFQSYRLDDWWPPSPADLTGMLTNGVQATVGGMAPNTFWNINGGKRDRLGIFAEWEARWNTQWMSLLGARSEEVRMNTGTVQGYNTSAMMYGGSSVGTIAQFNALDRGRTDHNLDLTALARNTPNASSSYEFGYARKTRSPNLYERYDWSSNGMALEMNNFVGDGNGYLGTPNLKPEVAHTLSMAGDWHDADRTTEFKATPYYTRVTDYIDAVRRPDASNMMGVSDHNTTTTNAFVKLQYANQSAEIYGLDLSGHMPLGNTSLGAWGMNGLLNYTRGKNLTTGGNLYNIMPLNAKLVLTQNISGWDNALELIGVEKKTDTSGVRNEIKTPGYSLVNIRGSYSWSKLRFDFGVENLFDKMYSMPLGGAYTGQGATMSLNREVGTIGTTGGTASMWGTAVPGMGRSIYAGATLKF